MSKNNAVGGVEAVLDRVAGRVLRRCWKILVIPEPGNVGTVLSNWAINISHHHSWIPSLSKNVLRANRCTHGHRAQWSQSQVENYLGSFKSISILSFALQISQINL